jgi:hypothetical protein
LSSCGSANAGATIQTPVGLIDLAPAVLALTGVTSSGSERLPGRALPLPGDPTPEARRLFAETFYPRIHLGWSDLASLTDGRVHYIHAPRPEFYDLETDPGEKTDLSRARPDGFRALRAEIEKMPRRFEKPSAIDPEQAKKLASLGYLTGGSGAEAVILPDPKDGLPALGLMKDGFTALNEGRYAAAARIFRGLLDTNPRMEDAWSRTRSRCSCWGDSTVARRPQEKVHSSPPTDPLHGDRERVWWAAKRAEARGIALSRGDPAARSSPGSPSRAVTWRAGPSKPGARGSAAPACRSSHWPASRSRELQRRCLGLKGRSDDLGPGLTPLRSLHYLKGGSQANSRPEEAERAQRAAPLSDNADAKVSLALLAAWGRRPTPSRRGILAETGPGS